MEALTFNVFVFIVATLLLAAIAVSAPRKFNVKMFALALALFGGIFCYIGFADLLSRPKPVKLEWVHKEAPDATVIGFEMIEGKGIYVLLRLPKEKEPRYYVLPWDMKLAEELQKAAREAERNKGELLLRLPFKHSWEDREPQKFHAIPQPAAPEKEPQGGAQEFQHPGKNF